MYNLKVAIKRYLARLAIRLSGDWAREKKQFGKIKLRVGQKPTNAKCILWQHTHADMVYRTYDVSIWYPDISESDDFKYENLSDAMSDLALVAPLIGSEIK